MSAASHPGYYVRRRDKLLRRFDWFARRARRRLGRRFGKAFADEVIGDARGRFEHLLPRLPYVGGRQNPLSSIVEANGWIIALHLAMRDRGRSVEECVGILCEVADDIFRSWPPLLRRWAGRLALSGPVRRRMKKAAERSQLRRHAGDWVYTVREGDEGVSLVFEECGVQKLYEALRVEELKPFCNFFDITYSRHLGMGLDATRTLGLGCPECILRFRKGEETSIPPRLEGLIPRTGPAEGRAPADPGG